jgi:predicted ATPase with chaperone activity
VEYPASFMLVTSMNPWSCGDHLWGLKEKGALSILS